MAALDFDDRSPARHEEQFHEIFAGDLTDMVSMS